MTNITDQLKEKLKKARRGDEAWVTFVRDHKDTIIANSTNLILTGPLLDRYNYKLPHLLDDNKCKHHWITLLINNVKAYDDLSSISSLFIPSDAIITTLYSKYRNSTNTG